MNERDGAAWLDGLAAQYETTARKIRETAALIRHQSLMTPHEGAIAADGSVTISEAIRQVLNGAAGRPMTATQIYHAIAAMKIHLRTRSTNPKNLVQSTLASLEQTGQVCRADGGWRLVT